MSNLLSEYMEDIEEQAATVLRRFERKGVTLTYEKFCDVVEKIKESCIQLYDFDDSLKSASMTPIIKSLQENFSVRMKSGIIFAGEKYTPWLEQKSGDIDWYYWGRYRKDLQRNKFPSEVVREISRATEQILDHLEDPEKPGEWDRRGMVVGHVQSGKTANYTGLICKAADSGYKVIIVLAGMLNSLRNQTQERIDSGFIGRCTRLQQYIGVGDFNNERTPVSFTTAKEDFNRQFERQLGGLSLDNLNEPVVLVLKKNSSTLANVIRWVEKTDAHVLQKYPMLLIDDEADHASVNTKAEGVTAINEKIRRLLALFSQSSYVGYTATPYANIFIDPVSHDEMLKDNLFPRDFILSLEAPDNYFGPDRVFSCDSTISPVREIYDYGTWLPLKHKINHSICSPLPRSLRRAICAFVLGRAIRLCRGHRRFHLSMMINVSRFTAIQSKIRLLVDEYVKEEMRPAVLNYSNLSHTEAMKNKIMRFFYTVWKEEFSDAGVTWHEVQATLSKAIKPVGVIEVNGASTAEPLNYNRDDYPEGRMVIAVGGLALARGITLEGLSVSYFLRNSMMYDTLLQMGRWFGYRIGYEDLCRVFMPSDAASWYRYISEATNELRGEFVRMKDAQMTPMDFGLCVRSHPDALIVTARNKMRTGRNVDREIGLEGRLVETKVLLSTPKVVRKNLHLLEKTLKEVKEVGITATDLPVKNNKYWREVPWTLVKSFVDEFVNHPRSDLTQCAPLKQYGDWLSQNGYSKWDVMLVNPTDAKSSMSPRKIVDIEVQPQLRSVEVEDKSICFSNRKVAQGDLETRSIENGKGLGGAECRKIRDTPLLMLHLLDCVEKKKETSLFEDGILAWGISFPGVAGSKRPKKLVKYTVNVIWWKNEYEYLLEGDDLSED